MSRNPAEALKARIRADLGSAIREKRVADVSLLRSLLGAIDNAEAVPVGDRHDKYRVAKFGEPTVEAPRKALSGEDLQRLLQDEIDARLAAARELASGGRVDRAALLEGEAAALRNYLV